MSKITYKARVKSVWFGSKEVNLEDADQAILKRVHKICPEAVSKIEGSTKTK